MPTTSNAKKCQLQSKLIGCPSNRKWTEIWFSCKSCIFTAHSFTSWNTSYWFTATTEKGKWKISKTISITNNLTYAGIALTAPNRRNSSSREGLSRPRPRPLYFIIASKSSCSTAFTDGTIELSFSWNDDSLKRPERNFSWGDTCNGVHGTRVFSMTCDFKLTEEGAGIITNVIFSILFEIILAFLCIRIFLRLYWPWIYGSIILARKSNVAIFIWASVRAITSLWLLFDERNTVNESITNVFKCLWHYHIANHVLWRRP